MPRPKSTPAYCVHKRSGQAYVTIGGRQIPLGRADTPNSRAAYDRIIGQWFSNGRSLPADQAPAPPAGPTMSVVVEAFWTHAQAYYSKPALDSAGKLVLNNDGTARRTASEELDAYRQVLRQLRRMYGATEAAAFGCPELEALREAMIRPRTNEGGQTQPGWCRTHANRQVGRIKHVFGWAVTKGLVSVAVHETLLRLPGLRAGKSDARDPDPVLAVDEKRALGIVPHVSPQVGAMIRVQLLTGMRSTELCIMRPRDVDRSRTPWVYTPMFHKTQGHGIVREIPIGPKAREILTPFLDRDPDAFMFSPAEAEAHRHRRQREKRKTKVQPSQVLRAEKSCKRRRRRQSRKRYDRNTYYAAIRYGCELAFGMPRTWRPARPSRRMSDQEKAEHKKREAEKAGRRAEWHQAHSWHPHMIRHRTATDLRRGGGLEVAQVVLGHTNKKTTMIYAEADVEKAHKVVERVG